MQIKYGLKTYRTTIKINILTDLKSQILLRPMCNQMKIPIVNMNNKQLTWDDYTPVSTPYVMSRCNSITYPDLVYCPVTVFTFTVRGSLHRFMSLCNDTIIGVYIQWKSPFLPHFSAFYQITGWNKDILLPCASSPLCNCGSYFLLFDCFRVWCRKIMNDNCTKFIFSPQGYWLEHLLVKSRHLVFFSFGKICVNTM